MAEVVSQTITLINDCINVDARYKTKKVMDRMMTISAVGSLIKDLIGFHGPKPANPVMGKLNELSRQIGDLSHKMSHLFNELKSFITEHDFYMKIGAPASTLMKYVENTLSNPCDHTIGLFRKECEATPPLRIAMDFISQLENESTNPLKMAMKADKLKTRQTFDKWIRIIDGVLGQLLFLETYLNGLFWDRNMVGPNLLKERIADLKHQMHGWHEDYYKNRREYWDGVKEMVERIQNKPNQCNEEKANNVRDELDNIMTNNTFYVIVYDACSGYGNHAFSHYNDNFICSFERGGCNVVVFRSFRDHERGVYARRFEVAIKNRSYPNLECYINFTRNLRNDIGGDCGYVAMIKTKYNAHIRFVNCDLNDIPNGPGAYTVVETPSKEGFYNVPMYPCVYTIQGAEFWVIAGLR